MSDTKNTLISDEMSEKIIQTVEKLATTDGAHTVNVRKVLQELDITNRVFYNRFKNIDEVLQIVYEDTILKIREKLKNKFDEKKEFFSQVMEILESILIASYDVKKQFNHYVFEHDSLSRKNYEWWSAEIKKLIEYAKKNKLIKEVDSDMLSYSMWCFCRGYNADAVGRNLSKEDAVKNFRYGFGLLLNSIKI